MAMTVNVLLSLRWNPLHCPRFYLFEVPAGMFLFEQGEWNLVLLIPLITKWGQVGRALNTLTKIIDTMI
jgi:hypothetical protein